jgi:dTDP-4-amino-4,6-dideoxygalactose transaminase
MTIPLLDLQAQYHSIKEEIDGAVTKVLAAARFILGPEGEALEKEIAALTNTAHAVGVANGTDALVLTLRALGIKPGDEVITTTYTFFASAECILHMGATPVFVDIDPVTMNMDLDALEAKITPRTRAIIAVHIFGQMLDMPRLKEIAAAYNLTVIEDAAQAIGASYEGQSPGNLSRAATFSFFPTKNLGAYGDGGMVVTQDGELAAKLRRLRFHGCEKKYYHEEWGYNSRLDELQAAILRVKLNYLERWNEARRDIAATYNAAFADIVGESGCLTLPVAEEKAHHVYHLYVLRTPHREKLQQALSAQGIAHAVYYPLPLHRQKVFAGLLSGAGDFPVAERTATEALAIPCYPELSAAERELIINTVKTALSVEV